MTTTNSQPTSYASVSSDSTITSSISSTATITTNSASESISSQSPVTIISSENSEEEDDEGSDDDDNKISISESGEYSIRTYVYVHTIHTANA